MKLQKFIDALDLEGIKASEFFEKNGKDIFQNTKLLMTLLDLRWGKKTHVKLVRLAWIIFAEFMTREYEKKQHFDILPIYKHFQEYMYAVSYFGRKCIPFHEWEDLAKENAELLKILIKEGKFGKHKKDARYLNLGTKYFARNEKLVKKYERLAYPEGT